MTRREQTAELRRIAPIAWDYYGLDADARKYAWRNAMEHPMPAIRCYRIIANTIPPYSPRKIT